MVNASYGINDGLLFTTRVIVLEANCRHTPISRRVAVRYRRIEEALTPFSFVS